MERGTVDIARALAAAGWKAVVVSAGGRMASELERAGAVHETLAVGSKNPLDWPGAWLRLKALLREHGADVVHARSRMPAWIAWRAARALDLPFVTTVHGRYRDANAAKRLYNSVMGRGDRVIAVSDYVAGEFAPRHGVGPDRLRPIPRGTDLDRFDPARVAPERTARLAEEWGLPAGAPVVLLPGRVTRWKGHGPAIDALARFGGGAPARCVMAGGWRGKERYKAELEARAARLGLGGRILFPGDCADMPAAYALSDVVLSPSLEPETFGRVVVEAMAMGRPVVASDHGGAAETMAGSGAGRLVPPGDADALAAAIGEMLAMSRGERAALAARATAHVRAHFSLELMCARTLAVYREVLEDKRGRA